MGRLLVVLILISQPAFAAVALVYEPDPELACPDEEALRRLIAARLGNDPFVVSGEAQVSVRIKGGTPVTAEVALESPRGAPPRRKSLTGSSCTSLLNSVALTVALAVDPLLRKAEAPPASEPLAAPEEPQPEPEKPQPQPEQPQPRPEDSPPEAKAPPVAEVAPPAPVAAATAKPAAPSPGPALRGSVSAGVSVNVGASIVAQPTLRAEGRLHGSIWSVGVEGRFGWPVKGPLTEGALTTSAILGAVVPCLTWWWLSGCADVSLGALRLEGEGLTDARLATVFHLSVGLRAHFVVPIGKWFRLGAMLEGQVPLTRATALVGETRVWTVWPVGLGFGLWAGVAL